MMRNGLNMLQRDSTRSGSSVRTRAARYKYDTNRYVIAYMPLIGGQPKREQFTYRHGVHGVLHRQNILEVEGNTTLITDVGLKENEIIDKEDLF